MKRLIVPLLMVPLAICLLGGASLVLAQPLLAQDTSRQVAGICLGWSGRVVDVVWDRARFIAIDRNRGLAQHLCFYLPWTKFLSNSGHHYFLLPDLDD